MHGHWLNHYLGKNKASGGGSGGAFVVHDVDGTLDKTYAEIAAATETGVVVMPYREDDGRITIKYLGGAGLLQEQGYAVFFGGIGSDVTWYYANSESEFPADASPEG